MNPTYSSIVYFEGSNAPARFTAYWVSNVAQATDPNQMFIVLVNYDMSIGLVPGLYVKLDNVWTMVVPYQYMNIYGTFVYYNPSGIRKAPRGTSLYHNGVYVMNQDIPSNSGLWGAQYLGSTFVLPATISVLGSVIAGSGLTVDENGSLSLDTTANATFNNVNGKGTSTFTNVGDINKGVVEIAGNGTTGWTTLTVSETTNDPAIMLSNATNKKFLALSDTDLIILNTAHNEAIRFFDHGAIKIQQDQTDTGYTVDDRELVTKKYVEQLIAASK